MLFLPAIAGFLGFVERILSIDSSLDFTMFDITDFIGNIGRMELVGISAFICSAIRSFIAILFDETACPLLAEIADISFDLAATFPPFI